MMVTLCPILDFPLAFGTGFNVELFISILKGEGISVLTTLLLR